MNADAPACAARTTQSGSRCAVTTATTASGATSRIRRVAVRPSWPGHLDVHHDDVRLQVREPSRPPGHPMTLYPRRSSPTHQGGAHSSSAKLRWSSTTRTVVVLVGVSNMVELRLAPRILVGAASITVRATKRARVLRADRRRLSETLPDGSCRHLSQPDMRPRVMVWLGIRRAPGARGVAHRVPEGGEGGAAPCRATVCHRADRLEQIVGIPAPRMNPRAPSACASRTLPTDKHRSTRCSSRPAGQPAGSGLRPGRRGAASSRP